MIWWTQPNFANFSPPHVIWWTQKPHVIWWTQIKFFPFQNLMCFYGPKTSCGLMDPCKGFQSFPLSKHHVIWWIHYATKTSCVLVDPKPHVVSWTLDDFQGPSNHMRFLGPLKDRSAQKTHVIWWTHIFNLIGSIKPHEVSSAVVPRFSNLIWSIKAHEVSSAVVAHFKKLTTYNCFPIQAFF